MADESDFGRAIELLGLDPWSHHPMHALTIRAGQLSAALVAAKMEGMVDGFNDLTVHKRCTENGCWVTQARLYTVQ